MNDHRTAGTYRVTPIVYAICEWDTLPLTSSKEAKAGYTAFDDRIAKTAAKKDALLTVLSMPIVPLHNNSSELQARVSARRRDVSLHSRSIRGAQAMDIFTTIVQTCKKLGLSTHAYLADRLNQQFALPSLAQSISLAAQEAANKPASV